MLTDAIYVTNNLRGFQDLIPATQAFAFISLSIQKWVRYQTLTMKNGASIWTVY